MNAFSHRRTLLVAADGRRARLYEEPARGADLIERAQFALNDEDSYEPQDRQPRTFNRVGAHRSAMGSDDTLHEREEENFLTRLAAAIAAQAETVEEIVLFAPPRALGSLRAALPDRVSAKLTHDAPLDILNEDAAKLKQRLKDLRLP